MDIANEQHFLDAIIASPDDDLPRLALIDWLAEQGDPRAELMHIQQQLRKIDVLNRDELETRMREMLYEEHIEPIVPTITNSIGMKFALIPSGEFMMEYDVGNFVFKKKKQVRITISHPFLMAIHQVTRNNFIRVMDQDPSWFSDNRLQDEFGWGASSSFDEPVEYLTWNEANSFCEILPKIPVELDHQRKYRLPTEAEWEYACRAGTTTQFHYGDLLKQSQANISESTLAQLLDEFALSSNFDYEMTINVGRYPPNGFGLHDMHGNVSEWCSDWNGFKPDTDELIDPQGAKTGKRKVARGGNFRSQAIAAQSSARLAPRPEGRSEMLGFRVVLECSPAK